MDERPLMVSINCTVYNHEPYLRQCLDGFVMQKTNFRFEAIVHDDASTDGSAAIIHEYAERYPDIIKPIYESENQYSKGDGSLRRIMRNAMKGKYMAICEGDDYWTDPNKLQMQFDFMESHPDYSMCFHDVNIKAEKGRVWYDVFGKLEERDYSGMENMLKWSVPTCSIFCIGDIYKTLPFNSKFTMGDNVLILHCSRNGKIRCIPKKMGVYRLTPTSWIGGQSSKVQRYKYISHYYGLIEEFEECRCKQMYGLLEGQYFWLLTILKSEGNKAEFNRVKEEYMHYPDETHWSKFKCFYLKSKFRYALKKVFSYLRS